MSAARIAAALAAAVAIAIPAEGLRQWAYRDPVGVLTVCYGSTTDVQPGKKYSLAECRRRLNADMLNAINTVEQCRPGLPEPMLAAFGDAVFNLGPTIVCDPANSRASRYLLAGFHVSACKELPRWNKARIAGQMVALPGLTARRQREMELCLSGAVK